MRLLRTQNLFGSFGIRGVWLHVGLALCLPSVGQPQGLPVPREIPKTQIALHFRRSSHVPLAHQDG